MPWWAVRFSQLSCHPTRLRAFDAGVETIGTMFAKMSTRPCIELHGIHTRQRYRSNAHQIPVLPAGEFACICGYIIVVHSTVYIIVYIIVDIIVYIIVYIYHSIYV